MIAIGDLVRIRFMNRIHRGGKNIKLRRKIFRVTGVAAKYWYEGVPSQVLTLDYAYRDRRGEARNLTIEESLVILHRKDPKWQISRAASYLNYWDTRAAEGMWEFEIPVERQQGP